MFCNNCGQLGHRTATCLNAPAAWDRKPCSKCRVIRPREDFYAGKNGSLRGFCIPCHAAYASARLQQNPEAVRKTARDGTARWRAANRETARAQDRAVASARRARARVTGQSRRYGVDKKDAAQPSVIYFIRVGDAGPIKIGWAKNGPLRRLADLQIAHFEELKIVGVIRCESILEETLVHDRFRYLRIRGEWFEPAPEILDYIAQHAKHWESISEREQAERSPEPEAAEGGVA